MSCRSRTDAVDGERSLWLVEGPPTAVRVHGVLHDVPRLAHSGLRWASRGREMSRATYRTPCRFAPALRFVEGGPAASGPNGDRRCPCRRRAGGCTRHPDSEADHPRAPVERGSEADLGGGKPSGQSVWDRSSLIRWPAGAGDSERVWGGVEAILEGSWRVTSVEMSAGSGLGVGRSDDLPAPPPPELSLRGDATDQ